MAELLRANVASIKEVMAGSCSDAQILNALNLHDNDSEKALNYLLEASHADSKPDSTDELRNSISHAFGPSTSGLNPHWSIGQSTWGEPLLPSSPSPKAMEWAAGTEEPPLIANTWDVNSDPAVPDALPALSGTDFEETREPLVLPSSPPTDPYQPVTVTGRTTPSDDFNTTQATRSHNPRQTPTSIVTRSAATAARQADVERNRTSVRLVSQPSVPEMSYEEQIKAAIQASLESCGQVQPNNGPDEPLKELGTEAEQISKAMEESLAMTSSRTLENSGQFTHPSPPERVRASGNPVGLRVKNVHLVFLPAVLVAMYAAKPFRDRILAFKPPPHPELQALVNHDVEDLWKGESSWRPEEAWGDKAHPIETILAIQRLFALMTHSGRSYLDVRELSLLLGYEEGEGIHWSLNEPSKGCHQAYGTIADTWKELCSAIIQEFAQQPVRDPLELAAQEESERRLFHWCGHKLSLPLPSTGSEITVNLPDNSTTCLVLDVMGPALNEIYACIDAQVWQPETNTAHFLDGISQILAFEIDRKSNKVGDAAKKPFKLEPELWVDRYLLEKRYQIVELREEISRIEGEADVSLARRNQLAKAGGKDVVGLLKGTVEYLAVESQFAGMLSPEREENKRRMLPKFKAALVKLETELASLELRASEAQAASKAVFDVEEMKQTGPHDLCAVVVSDGFPGRDHMWTYVKADDGQWFKLLDRHISSVTFETVLNDPAGIHLNSGHIFALYVRRPAPEEPVLDSLSIRLPPSLEAAITKDNHSFAAEVAATSADTLPVTLSDLNTGRNMEIDSPRSDVAEAGELGGLAHDPDSEPLRLSGGAGFGHEESGGEDDEVDSDLVELGFLKTLKGKLDPKTMTGKIGGRPIWLVPSLPLDSQSVTCSSCGQAMAFLLQMNAPDDENPWAYLRTIYVFACRKMSCIRLHSPGALKAFRIQVSDEQESSLTGPASNDPHLAVPFKEWELVCDEEPEDSTLESKSLASPCIDPGSREGDEEDAKIGDTQAAVDDAFLKFQLRLARAPDQILRYLRISEPPVKPLYASSSICAPSQAVCPNCRATRTAEFQIMPTLLNSLEEVDESNENLDFGTIIVYTCPKSCKPLVGSGWIEETCLIQMFSDEGLNIGIR